MKLLLSVLASVALCESDCSRLTQENPCPANISPPQCQGPQICFNNDVDNKCAYACMEVEACTEPRIMWTKYELDADGNKELDANGYPVYTEYCAEHPHGYSYTCEWEENSAKVRASFPKMEKAADSHDRFTDNREYEFYGRSFEKDEYVRDMFNNVNQTCKALVNRNIDDVTGTTVFDFPLSREFVDKCDMDPKEVADDTGTYTDYNFAIGYENDYRTLPAGLGSVIGQHGRHSNLMCRVDRAAKKAFIVNPQGHREQTKDGDKTEEKITMEFSLDGKNGAWIDVDDVKSSMDKFVLPFGPEQIEKKEVFIRVKNAAEGRYIHMKDCTFTIHLSGDENKDSPIKFPIINQGCTIKDETDQKFYKEHTWIQEVRQNEQSDMFSMVFFHHPEAHAYELECNLRSCEPSDGSEDFENCQPADECANRYSSFLTGRRRRRNVGADGDGSDVVVKKAASFNHPCYQFTGPIGRTDPLCFPEDSANCWTRDSCQNH